MLPGKLEYVATCEVFWHPLHGQVLYSGLFLQNVQLHWNIDFVLYVCLSLFLPHNTHAPKSHNPVPCVILPNPTVAPPTCTGSIICSVVQLDSRWLCIKCWLKKPPPSSILKNTLFYQYTDHFYWANVQYKWGIYIFQSYCTRLH